MKISYGNSRMEKTWKNNEISWDAFCHRVSQTKITTETVEEYRKMTKTQQDQIEDGLCELIEMLFGFYIHLNMQNFTLTELCRHGWIRLIVWMFGKG